MSGFTTADLLDKRLRFVPGFARQAANVTFVNALKFVYMFADAAMVSNKDQIKLIAGYNDLADHYEKLCKHDAIKNNPQRMQQIANSWQTLNYISAASFALAIACYMAGYLILPISLLAFSWLCVTPQLLDPRTLPGMIRQEFNRDALLFSRRGSETDWQAEPSGKRGWGIIPGLYAGS